MKLVLIALLATLVLAAPAKADSLVFLKDGNVWIAGADGSGARQFTLHAYGWASPSEADDGTVVVAGGLPRTNADGSDSDGGSELYRFGGDGNQRGAPIPTWGSYSTPSCPTYPPTSVRVSPDATRIAYGIWECGDFSYTALWTPATATGLSFPSQTLGQEDFYEPAWIDSSRFVVSHAGPTVSSSQSQWFVHDVSAGDDVGPGWYEPAMTGTGAQGVISRAGNELAVFEDDAAAYLDGRPRHVNLWLYTSPNAGLPTAGWTKRCTLALDASTLSAPLRLSPSFSPDGTKLAWGDDRGIEIASFDCAAFSPRLVIAGASQPFYAKGDVQPAAASPSQPGSPAPGGGTTPTPAPAPAPAPAPPAATPTTPAVTCTVPKLKGRTLTSAERLLTRAHCGLGKVHRPKRLPKHAKLVVKTQSPRAGSRRAAKAKVTLTLSVKR